MRFTFVFTLVALIATTTIASAASPGSCAGKFVGQWEWTGGDRVDDVSIKPDGTFGGLGSAVNWTCSGNQFVLRMGKKAISILTLAPDGNLMTGATISSHAGQIVIRKGDLPAARTPSAPSGQPSGKPKPGTKPATNPQPVAGPFLKKPACPKGTAAIQGQRTYETGKKVPVWYCFKQSDITP